MQYVQGETLADLIRRRPLEIGQCLGIAVQLSDALAEAHSHGIIHRDIKPSNIMINARHQAKVMDFGLAKTVEARSLADTAAETRSLLTEPGAIIGTVPYMSPEQVRGETLDARSDIFSFGAVLYEMITGHQPFAAESAAMTISAIVTREPAPLARYSNAAPRQLERIVNKALHKDREERYQTTRDLLIDLKSLKHELEFEAELERSKSPGTRVTSEKPAVTDASQRFDTSEAAAVPTSPTGAYLVSGINRHRRAAIVALAALALAIAALAYRFYFAPSVTTIDSIAVLPFINEGGGAELEYLSDGMTEALISSLSHLHNISVKARSSVFRYKGKVIDPKKIGQELSVQAVLIGRVIQRAEQLTLTLELVDAKTENVIWSEQHQRHPTDLASLQSEIARVVLDKLRQTLTDDDEKLLENRHTDNTEAYQLYLQGRYQWNKRTKESLKRAVEYFQQAIDKDPTYALAYSGLAECYDVFNTYELAPPNEAYTKARMAAQKALEIDPTLGEAYAALADTRESFDWDFEGAERDYQKAITLAPNHALAHQWYGELLRKLGRHDEAIAEQLRAQKLDPFSRAINSSLGVTLFFARRYDESIAQFRKVNEMDADFAPPYLYLGRCYAIKGMYPEAIAEQQKAVAISNGGSNELAGLAYTFAKSGKRSEARKILEQLRERQKREYVDRGTIALIYHALGEKEEALANLEKAYQDKSTSVPYIKVNPLYDDEFRSDPRFQELLRRVGLR